MYPRCFNVTTGVRQGGILSPDVFYIYMEDHSEQLNECRTGCKLNDLLVNHLMYMDDMHGHFFSFRSRTKHIIGYSKLMRSSRYIMMSNIMLWWSLDPKL